MKFINLVLVISSIVGLVSAKCFGGGENWGGAQGRDLARKALDNVCQKLAHDYGPNQSQSICVSGIGGTRFDFNVMHVSPNYRVLGKAECIDGLTKEIVNCNKGGRTKYGNWQYTSDPNTGPCS